MLLVGKLLDRHLDALDDHAVGCGHGHLHHHHLVGRRRQRRWWWLDYLKKMITLSVLSRYRVFIKHCVFFQRFYNIPDSGLSLFSLGISVCTNTRQVEHQRCSRTDIVQKNHNILRKKHNL